MLYFRVKVFISDLSADFGHQLYSRHPDIAIFILEKPLAELEDDIFGSAHCVFGDHACQHIQSSYRHLGQLFLEGTVR